MMCDIRHVIWKTIIPNNMHFCSYPYIFVDMYQTLLFPRTKLASLAQKGYKCCACWCHDMETISALLSLHGICWSLMDSLHKGTVIQSLDDFLYLAWICCSTNTGIAVAMRSHGAHVWILLTHTSNSAWCKILYLKISNTNIKMHHIYFFYTVLHARNVKLFLEIEIQIEFWDWKRTPKASTCSNANVVMETLQSLTRHCLLHSDCPRFPYD